jgi:NADPH:quinone reductase-like Zn-dependent oxidoreductase
MASTVNRTDMGVLSGKPLIFRLFTGLPRPRNPVLGTDFAGQVLEVGREVQEYGPGDRVWGFYDAGLGSHAEYLCLDVRRPMALIPSGISYEHAAASAEGAHYAYNFIKRARVGPGARVMVHGGTGAIGSAAIQLLVHYGATVVATARAAHMGMVKTLGASQVIDYEKEDFTQIDTTFEMVFDAVGKSRYAHCKKLLGPGGKYLSSELGPHGENLFLPMATCLARKPRAVFPFPSDIPASLHLMSELLASGKFNPLVDKVYSLDQAQEAYLYVATGQKVGNVVLRMST